MIGVITRAAFSAAVCLGTTALLAGFSQAAPVSVPGGVATAPAAPAQIRSLAGNHSPTITSGPSYTSSHVAAGTSYNCPSGDLCAVIFDPTTSDYKVFFLRHCGRYYLAYWDAFGGYADVQTGNPTSYFYGESGNVLKSVKPSKTQYQYQWSDVWSIRTC